MQGAAARSGTLYGAETIRFFQNRGCKAGSTPLHEAFGIPALADDGLILADEDEIYFDGGSGDTLVGMRNIDFRSLLSQGAGNTSRFPPMISTPLLSQQAITPQNLTSLTNRYTPAGLREGIEAITELPVMPQTVQQILILRAHSTTSARDILRIVERDPSLAAQVVYWARSPLHGHPVVVDSLQTAIEQVLGVDNTLNLLLGSSMSQTFRIPADGPVGLKAFWRHSIYCASLVSELAKLLPESVDVKPELAYLCGLLHDFGYPVLGHVFPPAFSVQPVSGGQPACTGQRDRALCPGHRALAYRCLADAFVVHARGSDRRRALASPRGLHPTSCGFIPIWC